MNDHDSNQDDIELLFSGRFADANHVPVGVLTQVLSGLQRTVYLLAMEIERIETRKRERISNDIERKYVVLCAPSSEGSYHINAQIGDPSCDLFAPDDVREVRERLVECVKVISDRGNGELSELIPDWGRRTRVLESIRQMVPKKGSGIRLQIRRRDDAEFFNSLCVQAGLRRFLPPTSGEESIRTVTGRLSRIDFDDRKVTIFYQPTEKDLECTYDETVEHLLLENARELIQVTGRVILDENDQPKRITDVEHIQELDLSPFYLEEFEYPERKLRFRKPVTITPELDDTGQLLCLRDSDLGINVHAFTRDELDEALEDQIHMLWRLYGLADNETLTSKAQQLKKNLLDSLEEMSHAKR